MEALHNAYGNLLETGDETAVYARAIDDVSFRPSSPRIAPTPVAPDNMDVYAASVKTNPSTIGPFTTFISNATT